MHSRVVKQGPFVFLKDIAVMESALFVILFMASFIENYEMLYKGWFMAHYLHYNLFTLIVSSLLQIFFLGTIFVNWYFTYFEITEKEITRKSGIFRRRKKSIALASVVSVETYQTPFDRAINHASIVIERSDGKKMIIRNVPNFAEYTNIIKHHLHNISGQSFAYDVVSLIKEGEGLNVEFKETLRFDTRKNEVSKDMERAVIKSIVGFLNNSGGVLLIGVNDSGEVCGLEKDYQTLPRKNRDGFENHLGMLVKNMIGLHFSKYINLSFETIEGKDIAVVNVKSSHKPAYLRNTDNKEEFFVRVGNSTQPFSMSETAEYIKTNFRE